MQFADLHIHSNYSDGIYTLEEIIKIAICKKIKYASITDHDVINPSISKYEFSKDIVMIPGIELSSEYKGEEIHILGYFIDTNSKELKSYLNKIYEARINRVYEIVNRLEQNDIFISLEELDIKDSVSIGRSHIAKLMVSKGYVNNFKAAFYTYLSKNKPAYVPRYKIPFKEALKLIKDIGGISSLAHPVEIYKGISTESMIKDLKFYGLNAIEVFHPSHNLEEISKLYSLSKKYKLLITGGSDCHGTMVNGDILMGSYGLNENLMNKFLKYKLLNEWGKEK